MLTLFYSPGACSLAPHIVLEELGLEFERRPVLIAEGEHLSREYLKINPRGRVPTFIADGTVITEVPAILTYLASLKRDASLLPPDGSLDLAKTHEFAGWLSSTLHIAYAQLWRPERFLPEDVPVRLSADGRRMARSAIPSQRQILISAEAHHRVSKPAMLLVEHFAGVQANRPAGSGAIGGDGSQARQRLAPLQGVGHCPTDLP